MDTLRILRSEVLPRLEVALRELGVDLFDLAPAGEGILFVALEVVVARGDARSVRVRVELELAHGGVFRARAGSAVAKAPYAQVAGAVAAVVAQAV